MLASLCALLAALALSATPAFAAAPETPELTVKPIFASIAVFNGTLSPKGKVPAGGTYKFLYKASKTECVGGSETTPGDASGGAPEVLPPEEVKGLTPATEYTVCLQITNPASETATSSPVTFKTAAAAPPETPQALPPSDIERDVGHAQRGHQSASRRRTGPLQLRVHRVLQRLHQRRGNPRRSRRESSPQPVSAADRAEPDTTYTFCLKAINALGEATLSAPVTFTTKSLPEMRTVEPVTNITGTTAIVHGVLDPKAASQRISSRIPILLPNSEYGGPVQRRSRLLGGHALRNRPGWRREPRANRWKPPCLG